MGHDGTQTKAKSAENKQQVQGRNMLETPKSGKMTNPSEDHALTHKRQKAWGWRVAVAFFLAASGSGLFLLSLLVERVMGAQFNLGLILGIAVGGVATSTAFVLDLGRKERFWLVVLQPGKSWISRGIILIIMFVVFGLFYLAPEWLTWLPWTRQTGLGQTLMVVSALGAFGTMLYSGFALSSYVGIPFWNVSLLPVLCVFYAFLGGMGMMFTANIALADVGIDSSLLELMEIIVVVSTLILLFAHLITAGTLGTAAREASVILMKGKPAWIFFGGVMLLGLAMPLSITSYAYFFLETGAALSEALLVTVGIMQLVGGLLFRYSLLRVGVFSRVM